MCCKVKRVFESNCCVITNITQHTSFNKNLIGCYILIIVVCCFKMDGGVRNPKKVKHCILRFISSVELIAVVIVIFNVWQDIGEIYCTLLFIIARVLRNCIELE